MPEKVGLSASLGVTLPFLDAKAGGEAGSGSVTCGGAGIAFSGTATGDTSGLAPTGSPGLAGSITGKHSLLTHGLAALPTIQAGFSYDGQSSTPSGD